MIENKEIKYAAAGVAVILIWFLYLKDLIAPTLSSWPPYVAAIIYHIGIYVGIYLLSSLLVNNFNRIKFSAISISILAGLDIIDAPYIVDKFGNFNTSIEYWFTTYDAMFASFLSQFVQGPNLWMAVYIIIPIILIFILPIWIANPKAIKRILTGG